MAKKKKYEPVVTTWADAPVDDYNEEECLHSRLFSHVRALEQDQCEIHYQNLLNARIYSNHDIMALDWDGMHAISFRPLSANVDNVVAQVINTKIALVGKARPKATPVARAADFDVFLRTRQLDRFLYAEFIDKDVWTKTNNMYADGEIFGTGVLKVDIDAQEKDYFVERVMPDEIVVDQRECISSDLPQHMYHRKLVSRMWLMRAYGHDQEVVARIREAQTKNFEYTSYRSPSADQIIVIEAWRLPTTPGAGDGVHTICIENCTLLREEYKRSKFPFVFFRPKPALSGFYGYSTVASLLGYQIRLNKLNADIEIGQGTMCVPRVFLQEGTSFTKTQLDDTIGKIITVRGDMPAPQNWSAFTPEIYNERDRLYSQAFASEGVSALSSQSKLPVQARLDSSEAIREVSSVETERFSRESQRFEDVHIELAEHIIELCSELYKDLKVNKKQFYRSRYLAQQIDWADIDLERDRYVFQVSASSILNMSPAARKDKLNEWASSGAISMDQYRAYSGEPDIERLSDVLSAPHDYAEYVVEEMLSGNPQTPDPLSNLALNLDVVSKSYLHLRSLNTPEEILTLFRDYIVLCKELLAPTPEPQMAASAAAPGLPAGAPVEPGIPGAPAGAGLPPFAEPNINTVTGAIAPSISSQAASSFLG